MAHNYFLSAVKKGRKEDRRIVKTFLAASIDLNVRDSYGNTALKIAAGRGHEKMVRILLEKEADVNAAKPDW